VREKPAFGPVTGVSCRPGNAHREKGAAWLFVDKVVGQNFILSPTSALWLSNFRVVVLVGSALNLALAVAK